MKTCQTFDLAQAEELKAALLRIKQICNSHEKTCDGCPLEIVKYHPWGTALSKCFIEPPPFDWDFID